MGKALGGLSRPLHNDRYMAVQAHKCSLRRCPYCAGKSKYPASAGFSSVMEPQGFHLCKYPVSLGMMTYAKGTGHCMGATEPLYTVGYVRWRERSAGS